MYILHGGDVDRSIQFVGVGGAYDVGSSCKGSDDTVNVGVSVFSVGRSVQSEREHPFSEGFHLLLVIVYTMVVVRDFFVSQEV